MCTFGHCKKYLKCIFLMLVFVLFFVYFPYKLFRLITPPFEYKIYDTKELENDENTFLFNTDHVIGPLKNNIFISWTGASKDGLHDMKINTVPKPKSTIISKLLNLSDEPYSFNVCIKNLGTSFKIQDNEYPTNDIISVNIENIGQKSIEVNYKKKECIEFEKNMIIKSVSFPLNGKEVVAKYPKLANIKNIKDTQIYIQPNFVITMEPKFEELLLIIIIVLAAVWKILFDGIYKKFKEIIDHFRQI